MVEAAEDQESSKRTLLVNKRVLTEPPTDLGETPINWEQELRGFKKLAYPSYYLEPFHSVPGGWLSKSAALMNRRAVQAIYTGIHLESTLGVRKELTKSIKAGTSSVIVDFGAGDGDGDGDGAAAVARAFPNSKVIALEASPFMIIVGRRQNRDVPNMVWKHALAEESGLATDSIDFVQLQLVLHECSDEAKVKIGKEANRIIRPGGLIVVTDTPQSDLASYRGFLEPHKEAWAKFNPSEYFKACGFEYDGTCSVIGSDNSNRKEGPFTRTFTWIATKR